jgi:hypothetical protein
MVQTAVSWSVAIEPTDHVGRTVAVFLLKPEAEAYSPSSPPTNARAWLMFSSVFISQAGNRNRSVEDSSSVHTLQRKLRCDVQIRDAPLK